MMMQMWIMIITRSNLGAYIYAHIMIRCTHTFSFKQKSTAWIIYYYLVLRKNITNIAPTCPTYPHSRHCICQRPTHTQAQQPSFTALLRKNFAGLHSETYCTFLQFFTSVSLSTKKLSLS